MEQALLTKILQAPKAELPMHIEGSLEPEQIFAFARRNKVKLAYDSIEALRAAYAFTDLQSFLDIYYAGASVLLEAQDFYEMTRAYLDRARADRVIHTELFFDPQTHTERGVRSRRSSEGIEAAMAEAEREHGLTSKLILCFLRHLPEDAALDTYEKALPMFERYGERLVGIGLDSSERDYPPSSFARVFAKARDRGLRRVAHAGEEGPPAYIREALEILRVERIDHGVRSIEDPALVRHLADARIALTVCPLSNLKLKVFDEMERHSLKALLDAGVAVTVNSDDPAYFGGYVNENYRAVAQALDLGERDLYTLARNSLEAAFVDAAQRRAMVGRLDAYWHG